MNLHCVMNEFHEERWHWIMHYQKRISGFRQKKDFLKDKWIRRRNTVKNQINFMMQGGVDLRYILIRSKSSEIIFRALATYIKSVKKNSATNPFPSLITVAGCQNIWFFIFFSLPHFQNIDSGGREIWLNLYSHGVWFQFDLIGYQFVKVFLVSH